MLILDLDKLESRFTGRQSTGSRICCGFSFPSRAQAAPSKDKLLSSSISRRLNTQPSSDSHFRLSFSLSQFFVVGNLASVFQLRRCSVHQYHPHWPHSDSSGHSQRRQTQAATLGAREEEEDPWVETGSRAKPWIQPNILLLQVFHIYCYYIFQNQLISRNVKFLRKLTLNSNRFNAYFCRVLPEHLEGPPIGKQLSQ